MGARRLLTAAAWALVPIVVVGALGLRLYLAPVAATIDFERRYEAPFLDGGFYGREREGPRGFRWTDGDGVLRLRHLPSGGRLRVAARLKIVRPADAPLPLVSFSVDGATVHRVPGAPGTNDYVFETPFRGPDVRLGIHSDTFTAGDGRRLGVQVRTVRVTTDARGVGSLRPLAALALAALLAVGGFVAAGVPVHLAARAAVALGLVFAYLLSQDALRWTDYPDELALLAGGVLLFGAAVRVALARWWPGLASRERWLAGGLLVLLAWIKLGAVDYPLWVGSDLDFHANRLAELLAGNWWPTSVSQHEPPFRIPYPVSLYAVAAPWVRAGLEPVFVLKTLTALADLGVSVILLYLGARWLDDLAAGALAAAVYELVPLDALSLSAGNLSNLFGVATATAFFALLVAGSRRPAAAVAGGLVALLALTAHFGTFLMALVLWPVWLVGAALAREDRHGPYPFRLWLGVTAASLVAAGVYYAGYWELVAGQWERALSGGYATGGAAVEGPLDKLRFNLAFYREQLGVVFAVVAGLGAIELVGRRRRNRLAAAATGWLGVLLLFLVVDLATAVEVRYVLQSLPLLALFAGAYLAGAARRAAPGRIAAIAALGYLAYVGLATWHDAMLFRYH